MEGMTHKEMSEQSFIPLKKLDERIEIWQIRFLRG